MTGRHSLGSAISSPTFEIHATPPLQMKANGNLSPKIGNNQSQTNLKSADKNSTKNRISEVPKAVTSKVKVMSHFRSQVGDASLAKY